MTNNDLDKLKIELAISVKSGLAFIISASIIWSIISFIWTLSYSSYNKSVFTFIVGGLMLPMAFLMTKIIKASWGLENNPLQPLGLILNFAQLFYFPILIFSLIKTPDYFIMVYAIITGAHFFPYAWLYKTNVFAIIGAIISLGAMIIGLMVSKENLFLIPLFVTFSLVIMSILLGISHKNRLAEQVNLSM